MPRKTRIDAPGALLHHIIVRGIERRKVFMFPRREGANRQRASAQEMCSCADARLYSASAVTAGPIVRLACPDPCRRRAAFLPV